MISLCLNFLPMFKENKDRNEEAYIWYGASPLLIAVGFKVLSVNTCCINASLMIIKFLLQFCFSNMESQSPVVPFFSLFLRSHLIP